MIDYSSERNSGNIMYELLTRGCVEICFSFPFEETTNWANSFLRTSSPGVGIIEALSDAFPSLEGSSALAITAILHCNFENEGGTTNNYFNIAFPCELLD